MAGFQNTLTLLSTELCGRTYGGGVLELVPSEIARVSVPVVDMREELPRLDAMSRAAGGQRDAAETVRRRVDEQLARQISGLDELLHTLDLARTRLVSRRLRS